MNKSKESKEIRNESFNSLYQIFVAATAACLAGGDMILAGGGTFLTQIIGLRSKLKFNRASRFVEEFMDFMTKSQTNFDRDYINSEDFSDFFEDLIISVSKTNSDLKIKRYKNILLNQLIVRKDYDTSVRYLNLANNLEENQIVILQHWSLHEFITPTLNIGLTKEQTINLNSSRKLLGQKIEHSELEFLVIDLRSKGLLKRKDGAMGATRPISIFDHHSITEIGKEFVDYLRVQE